MRSFHEERIVDFIFLALSSRLLDPLCQTFGERSSEIYFLNVVAALILAENEESVWLVVQAADQAHSTHWILVKVGFAEQVEEAMLLDVNDF